MFTLQDIRKAYEAFQASCTREIAYSFKWYKKIDKSQYFTVLSLFLRTAKEISRLILKKDKGNILLECETGTDVSTLITSLALILINKEMRTFNGFKDYIINKLWVQYGHPFENRYAIGKPIDEHYCPLFHIFLDCVYQILYQFPTEFEFNEYLLISLGDAVMQGKYGTFLLNNQYEREQMNVEVKCVNYWDEIDQA
jgi:hypothetical protein